MRACSVCGRLYPDDAGFCPIDGNALVSATQAPVATSEEDARIGQLMCGRYQVRRVVADGGMGRVYEALDMADKRNVALKILHPDVANDDVALERFKREFEVSKLLSHEHIVDVLDFQPTHDGSYALVMEFLYGEELRNALKREGVLSPERVVRMLSQIAIALDPAHARKLVHRDLKPDNVFLCQTSDGDTVKLLDFGSVKDKADTAKKLTVMGTTIGSPYYMAPEQAQGLETLDHRADVWALAAISYECITGAVPFKGNNGPSILLEILTKEPMSASNAAKSAKYPVPPTVDKVMSAAFKKNPGMRIPSVGALADAFGEAYGLTGNHTEWAKATQQTLGDQIEARMPDLMKATGPTTVAEAGNKFFGNADLNVADPFASPPRAPGPAPALVTAPAPAFPVGPGPTLDDEMPAGVPRSNSFALLIALGVGGLAVVIGIVIVVVLLR